MKISPVLGSCLISALVLVACTEEPIATSTAPAVSTPTATPVFVPIATPTAIPWRSMVLVRAELLSDAIMTFEECPVSPYYVNLMPISVGGTDGFGAGTRWYRSTDNQLWAWAQPDGWRVGVVNEGGVKEGWLKPSGARLEIIGRRLDGDGTLTASVPDGYIGDFQVSGLFFSSAGCWEIEGQAKGIHLRFIVYVRP